MSVLRTGINIRASAIDSGAVNTGEKRLNPGRNANIIDPIHGEGTFLRMAGASKKRNLNLQAAKLQTVGP
ncbi:MAG: hypothetical protein HY913_12955 [Desulfomonile tiedjei]|nr:hypothetical protein [Desulfomonile tiedjei]